MNEATGVGIKAHDLAAGVDGLGLGAQGGRAGCGPGVGVVEGLEDKTGYAPIFECLQAGHEARPSAPPSRSRAALGRSRSVAKDRSEQHDVNRGGECAGSVAFSPDSKWLVAAGELVPAGSDETIPIWDTNTGKERCTLKGHVNGIFSVTFSSDGQMLATAGSQQGEVILWDFANGRKLRTLEPKTDRIWAISFAPDFKTLVSGGEDGMIRLWDVGSGRELRRLQTHSKEVMSVAFREDGKLLASGSRDGEVKLWEFPSGKEVRTFKGHTDAVTKVLFHPDGKSLATASYDRTVPTLGSERGSLVVAPLAVARRSSDGQGYACP